jgi:hypothetical protein
MLLLQMLLLQHVGRPAGVEISAITVAVRKRLPSIEIH